MGTPEPLATPEEVAAYLGRSVQALAQLRFTGTGPAFLKTGRLIRYQWAAVEAWARQNTANSTRPQHPAGSTE
ncbi:helix-turn-helix transcriptional regulator [Kocuria flava]|uniref:Helix-turn-helix domain-containing protein n=1 Tax=Kocuria flava TaxID=446860 RepID=A0ABQ0XDR0_9MICC|nr:helix-turn-helix domain-containing protein [Kocuria flava]GEO93844.1 hypothetical protein KFL01_31500 [Kocuria flava]